MKKTLSLLLALALLLGAGCERAPAPAPSATPAPSPAPTLPPLPAIEVPEAALDVPFSKMVYARPDVAAAAAWMEEVTARIPGETAYDTLLEWAETAKALYEEAASMATLAMLHSAMDKSDGYWLEEYDWISRESIGLYYAFEALRIALLDHPEADRLIAALPETFFEGVDEGDLDLEALIPLYEEEQALINTYAARIATAEIVYEDRPLSIDAIYALPTYSAYREAMALWMEAHQEEFALLYIELVKLRREIAAISGYESYAEHLFALEGRDYTPADMAAHIDALAESIVPAYAALEESMGSRYYPEAALPLAEFLPFLEDTLAGFAPVLAEPLKRMEAQGLADLEARPYKESGAFTTYLAHYEAPFLFMTYGETLSSMNTFVHEYGHFLDYALVPEKAALETLDTAEVYSQALELLVANHYGDVFDEDDAYMLRYDTLSEGMQVLVSQPYYTAIELAVYALPEAELTIERIDEIAYREALRFGLTDEKDSYFYRQGWVEIAHLYEYPLYTFTYATSMDVALQLWALSLEDEAAAVRAYLALLAREESGAFQENVRAAGLKSPFDPSRPAELVALCEKYLVEEEWE